MGINGMRMVSKETIDGKFIVGNTGKNFGSFYPNQEFSLRRNGKIL